MVRGDMVGARVRRKEDPRLITGGALYVGDLRLAGMTHLALVRSIHAHAKIVRIDTSAARAAPGVLAVYTGEELRAFCGPLPGGGGGEAPPPEGGEAGDQAAQGGEIPTPTVWPLASDRVRYVGEPVVAIVAASEAAGRDAALLVAIEYEALPTVVDIEAASAPGATRIWEGIRDNLCLVYERQHGDAARAFAEAAVTVKQRIRSQRVVPLPLEGRAVAAQPDPLTGGLTVWTSSQAPHWARRDIAAQLGLPESLVRVIVPEVGGAFGCKIPIYREDLIVAAIARHLKRPIQWVEDRAENFRGTSHGRAQLAEIALAATREGLVTGLRLSVLGDSGAYPQGIDIVLTCQMATGVYAIPNVELSAWAVYTNTMAIGAYRGSGRPEAAYYIERAMDLLARRLALDPADLRRLNYIRPEAFPYESAGGLTYDTGEYARALDAALAAADYEQLRRDQEAARRQGRLLGIGLASYVEICGFGPWESSTVRVEPGGAVSVFTGISPHGQGQETTFAQIVADELGADFADIVVHHGDTASNPQGQGTFGSRGLAVGGSALLVTARKLREKAVAIAGHLLEAAAADIEYRGGRYQVRGQEDRFVTLKEIASAAYGGDLPADIDAGLVATDFFRPPGETYPFGTHLAVVEVDAETGQVRVLRYCSVDDCGTVISPLLAEGQVHGGLAQGIGQALFEEAVYDEAGQLVTGSLMDYTLPRAAHFPPFELHRTVTPTPLNPLGAKGIGEAATIGSTPAIANAVMDALAPRGIAHLDLPLTPGKVWAALRGRSGAGG